MPTIRISINGKEWLAELYDTETARLMVNALPIEGTCLRWGKELYFTVPISAPQEQDAQEIVEAGQLGYWPVGSAFCIFWGKTPASQGDEPRAASPVNVFGKLIGDLSALDAIPSGVVVLVEKMDISAGDVS